MISHRFVLSDGEGRIQAGACGAGNLESDEAIVVRARKKDNGSHAAVLVEFNLGEYILRGNAVKVRAARQRCYPRETGFETGAFRRQGGIRSAGSDRNPMRIIAGLFRKTEISGKNRARLEFNPVAASCAIDCGLQVVPRVNRNDFPIAGRC